MRGSCTARQRSCRRCRRTMTPRGMGVTARGNTARVVSPKIWIPRSGSSSLPRFGCRGAQLVERILGAAPDDASLPQRDDERTQHCVTKQAGAERVQEEVERIDVEDTLKARVDEEDAEELEDEADLRPSWREPN